MANLRQEIAVGDTGAEFVAAFAANAKNANIRVYNVEDYGAVHDGVTDDTTKIQAAINACFAAGGGIVYFPNGLYIIAGALQNDVGDDAVDYNSQLYIPNTKPTDYGCVIRLLGESYVPVRYNYNTSDGVILKSTIEGSGLFPSVICSKAQYGLWGYNNYTKCHIENMRIVVPAGNTGDTPQGPTMCGINFLHGSRSYINNVNVSVDCDIDDMVEPVNKVFGIAQGFMNDDFPEFGTMQCSGGFYWGFVLGEGVHGITLESYRCKFALMLLGSNYGIHINYAILHWHQYMLCAQDDTYFDFAPSRVNIKIDFCSTEMKSEVPAWCDLVDFIYDPSNLLYGSIDHDAQQAAGLNLRITKSNGGLNLLLKNIGGINVYTWRAVDRPANPIYGTMGWNTTSDKLEVYDGTQWVDLH